MSSSHKVDCASSTLSQHTSRYSHGTITDGCLWCLPLQHEKFQSAPGSRVGTPAYLAPEVIMTTKGQTYDGKVCAPPLLLAPMAPHPTCMPACLCSTLADGFLAMMAVSQRCFRPHSTDIECW